MLLGYNTNGFAHHRLEDALRILADLGYQSVAITPDVQHLDPFAPGWQSEAEKMRRRLEACRLQCVVETGARFLLDPYRKHQPTLLAAQPEARQRRREFLQRCLHLAQLLGSPLVSLWSGTPEAAEPFEVLLDRLVAELHLLLPEAARLGIRLAFEPEPGMLVATLADFTRLKARIPSADFGLTADVGHLFCQGEEPIVEMLRPWKHLLWNIHLEDMRRGVHDHLMFGHGEMEFPPLLLGLADLGYSFGVHVELSRHSHDAVQTARRSRDYLLAAGFPYRPQPAL